MPSGWRAGFPAWPGPRPERPDADRAADRQDHERPAPDAARAPSSGRSAADGRPEDDRLADGRRDSRRDRLADDHRRDADRADGRLRGAGGALAEVGAGVGTRGALVERTVALRGRTIGRRGRTIVAAVAAGFVGAGLARRRGARGVLTRGVLAGSVLTRRFLTRRFGARRGRRLRDRRLNRSGRGRRHRRGRGRRGSRSRSRRRAFGRGLGGGFTLSGFLSRSGAGFRGGAIGGLTGLSLAGGVDNALTGAQFFLRKTTGGTAARRRAALRLLRAGRGAVLATLCRRRRGKIAGRGRVGPRPLGFHNHRLGPAVAEALLHDPSAHRALTGLQRDRGSSAGSAVFVLVAHALACTSAGRYPAKKTVRSM